MPANAPSKWPGRLEIWLLLACLTIIEFHTLSVLHAHQVGGPWDNLIPQLVNDIATGTDYYPHTAQRILLAVPVKFMAEKLGVNLQNAWLVSMWLMLLATNATTFFMLFRNEASKSQAAIFTAIQAASFICWQDWFVLAPYDLVDNVVWFLFAYGVWMGKRWPWFAVLFIIELHNREVAIFFPLWVALDSFLPLRVFNKSAPVEMTASNQISA